MRTNVVLLTVMVLLVLTSSLWATETWTVVYSADSYAASSNPKWPAGCPASNQLEFINDPLPGYLTISTGNEGAYTEEIWRHDTAVGYSTGITVELHAKVNTNSQDTSFFVGWFDAGGDCGIYLGQTKVYVGDATYGNQALHSKTFNTTTSIHIYRMTRAPNTNKVSLYIDNDTTAILLNQTCGTYTTANNYAGYTTGAFYRYYLIWGDNSSPNSGKNYATNVEVTCLRYHPGAQAPDGTNDLGSNTNPTWSTLPWSNITSWAAGTETWDGEYDGTGTPTSEGWTEAGGGQEYNSYFGTPSTGYFTEDGYGNAYINLNGIPTTGLSWDTTGITIEWRAQLAPDSPNEGYNVFYYTYNGGVSVTLSTAKVEIGDNADDCGYALQGPYYFNTTSTFHIYRLTVFPHESVDDMTYATLYIDNATTAVFSNYLGDAEQVAPRILMGCYDLWGTSIDADACLDYIRWHRGVTTPASLGYLVREMLVELRQ
jgi:hypothetical protein